jgi:hypothetical protein
MMNEARFWEIIDNSRARAREMPAAPHQDFITRHEQALAETLRQLSAEAIADFNLRFWSVHHQAYRWDLWGYAYWLHGGCGNDGFTDFRSCLISLGKNAFTAALDDPDSLTDLLDRPDMPYMQSEGFQYVAGRVYKEKTGNEAPLAEDDDDDSPSKPVGEKFDFEDDEIMEERFPKLVAKYPEMGD